MQDTCSESLEATILKCSCMLIYLLDTLPQSSLCTCHLVSLAHFCLSCSSVRGSQLSCYSNTVHSIISVSMDCCKMGT